MKQSKTKIRYSGQLSVLDSTQSDFEREFFGNFQSENTKTAYKKDLQQFFSFLNQSNQIQIHPLSVKKLHIVQYRNYLQKHGGRNGKSAAPKTIIRKLAAITTFYNFLIEKEYISQNPTQNVRRPTDSVMTETCDLTDQEARKVLSVINVDSPAGLLHKTILMIFLTTGMRKSELINLKVDDYKEEKGVKFLKIKCKGGKYHKVPLHPSAICQIEDYLAWRGISPFCDSPFLFQATTSSILEEKPLCPSSIDFIVKKYSKKACITENITPHSLRATVIGSLLDSGCDIYKVSKLVNHSSVKTTEAYDKRRKRLSDSPVFKIKYV